MEPSRACTILERRSCATPTLTLLLVSSEQQAQVTRSYMLYSQHLQTFFLCADAADIIEQRVSAAGGVSYYVHYVDCKSPCPALARRCLAVWSGFASGSSNSR